MVEQLGKPLSILQKKPAHHCLKSTGLPVEGWIDTAGRATGTVAAPSHPLPLPFLQQGIEAMESPRLRSGPNALHRGEVEDSGTGRLAAEPQPLVQFPDRVTKPGQLPGAQLLDRHRGDQVLQPEGSSRDLRLRGC